MKDDLPSESDIIALHKKYAPSDEIFNLVYIHCLAVWKIAEQIIASQELSIDKELVKTGCLLHDIGTYKLIQPTDKKSVGYVNRGVTGEQILEDEGLPKELCETVAHHVGHGLTKEHITETFLPLPHRDLTPKTIEERLVNYVSKLHTRADKPHFNSVSSYRKFLRDMGNDYYINEFEALVREFSEPDLNSLAAEFSQTVA